MRVNITSREKHTLHNLKMASFAKITDLLSWTQYKDLQKQSQVATDHEGLQRCWLKKNNLMPGSSQSIKIGIDLSIDKSIEIVESDLIDIDCIDQSVEIGRNRFVHRFILIFTDLIDSYRKIICSLINENWIHANGKCIDSWAAIESRRIKQLSLFQKIFKIFFFL